jgi:hypothetical protein
MRLITSVLYLGLLCGNAYAQSPGDMINIFGGIVQSGMAMAAQSGWQKLPSAEISCVDRALRQHGLSINLAIQQGIGPSDPRVFGERSSCRSQATGQQLASSGQSILTNYTVDGLALGGRVQFGSVAYQKYACAMRFPELQSVADCVHEETDAKQNLRTLWGTTPGSIRARCESDAVALGTRTYLDLLTCIQMADDVKWPSPTASMRGAGKRGNAK